MSEDYKIGYLLRDLRKAKGFTQDQVAYGIYVKSSYSRIESGEQDPDKLLLDVLFERMGMSVNQFGTSYTITEYLAIEWRNIVLEKLIAREWNNALAELQKYEEWLKDDGKNVGSKAFHDQFSAYIRLVVQMESDEQKDLEEGILAAIYCTIRTFKLEKFDNFLYGEQELALLILLAENWFRCGKHERSIRFYNALLEYMEERIEDEMERYRFYPETVLSLAAKLYEMGLYEKLDICEKGIEMLQKAHRMNGLEGLLHLRIAGWEKCGLPEEEKSQFKLYQQVEELLIELREKANIEESGMSYPLLKVGSRGYVLGERILRMRICLGMTQDELSEGICTPETLSRIERGERAPQVAVYEGLMKKLGMDGCRYYPSIESNDYQMHLVLIEYVTYIALNEYEKANEKLIILENNLDKSNMINQQLLLKNRAIVDERLNKISPEREVELLWTAFYMTVPKDIDIYIWPLNQTEVKILNNIAIAQEIQGKRVEAIELFKEVKRCFEFVTEDVVKYRNNQQEDRFQDILWSYRSNGMRMNYNLVSYLLIVENLIIFAGSEEYYEEAIQMSVEIFNLSYKGDFIYTLQALLYEHAWNTEQIMEENNKDIAAIGRVCIPMFYRSYLLAAISGQKTKMDHINSRCIEKYGVLWEDYFLSLDGSASLAGATP